MHPVNISRRPNCTSINPLDGCWTATSQISPERFWSIYSLNRLIQVSKDPESYDPNYQYLLKMMEGAHEAHITMQMFYSNDKARVSITFIQNGTSEKSGKLSLFRVQLSDCYLIHRWSCKLNFRTLRLYGPSMQYRLRHGKIYRWGSLAEEAFGIPNHLYQRAIVSCGTSCFRARVSSSEDL